MRGVHFTEGFDWLFVWEAFKLFINTNYIWILFGVMFLILLFVGDSVLKKSYLYPFLFMLLTVFNPVILELVGEKLQLETRFYRFFWLIPIIPVVAFGITALMGKIKKRVILRVVIFLGATCMIGALGVPIFVEGNAPTYQISESEFCIDSDIEDIYQLLHARGIEEPLVMYDGWLILTYHQYDASVLTQFGRAEIGRFEVKLSAEKVEKILDQKESSRIVELVYVREHIEVASDVFKQAVKELGIQYIVVSNEKDYLIQYIDECGFSQEGVTRYYTVFYSG